MPRVSATLPFSAHTFGWACPSTSLSGFSASNMVAISRRARGGSKILFKQGIAGLRRHCKYLPNSSWAWMDPSSPVEPYQTTSKLEAPALSRDCLLVPPYKYIFALATATFIFAGDQIPKVLSWGDWRVLTEEEQADSWRKFYAGEFGSCIQVPPDGWSSRTEHFSQITDKRSLWLARGKKQRRSTEKGDGCCFAFACPF